MQRKLKTLKFDKTKPIKNKDRKMLDKLWDLRMDEFRKALIKEMASSEVYHCDIDKPLLETNKQERKELARLYGKVVSEIAANKESAHCLWQELIVHYAYEDVIAYQANKERENSND